MTTALLLLAVVVLLALNGFFVAAEFALVRARTPQVEAAAQSGARGATLALAQLARIDEYLSACQVGITMASIGIGFLGELVVADILEPLLGDAFGEAAAIALAVAISYLLVTFLHITAGEQVPKIYSITHAETTLRRSARGLQLFRQIALPFIWLVNATSNWLLKALGVDAAAGFEEGGDPEEIKMLIARGMHGGILPRREAAMLSGVFHLHDQQIRHVMTPAPNIVSVPASASVRSALERCVQSGHTRLVVTNDSQHHHARGIVHATELARRVFNEGPDAPLGSSISETVVVPETRALDAVLQDLQRARASLAVVVDEYGRIAGVATIEDIIEEIVGEIADETDSLVEAVLRLPGGALHVRGDVALGDLANYGVALEADSDAITSIGGYVFSALGQLPAVGETVRAGGHVLVVESVRDNRIEAVRIEAGNAGNDGSEHRRDADERG